MKIACVIGFAISVVAAGGSIAHAAGACCLLDHGCVSTSNQNSCTSQCGQYQGNGSTCGALTCSPTTKGANSLQLAGHSLSPSAFPYFEKVATFNSDEALEVAIDPLYGSAITGKTCRIYVVEDRTKSQWMTCPRGSLNDVTGSYLETTFTGTTISQNTRTVAQANELSSRATPCYTVTINGSPVERCTGLGHGYDVVLDCDRDGYLSPGDFVDGFDAVEGTADVAGLYVVHDTTQGSLPTSCVDYGSDLSAFSRERVWAPSNFAQISGLLPLVVISHGNGHHYAAYNSLAQHLASYGYVVMSHENDTEPGPFIAAETTVAHTDTLLDIVSENPVSCAARMSDVYSCGSTPLDLCALHDKIDPHRIIWIGHSRGGGGVVWAKSRMELPAGDPSRLTPEHFGVGDIKLIASLAPIDASNLPFYPDPTAGNTPYAVIWASGDRDVSGAPNYSDDTQAFRLFERASGPKSSLYLHGGAHGWFHDNCDVFQTPAADCTTSNDVPISSPNCSTNPAPGNTNLLTPATFHKIVQGYVVPVIKHFVDQNEAAREFLWRPWERFHPIGSGTPQGQKVALEYRPPESTTFVDNFQTNSSPAVSSSGGSVTQNLDPNQGDSDITFEGLLQEQDSTFDWERNSQLPTLLAQFDSPDWCTDTQIQGCPAPGGKSDWCRDATSSNTVLCETALPTVEHQPMNGMTRGWHDDASRGFVFEWTAAINQPYLQFAIPTSIQDFTQRRYLSFRLAQMPRHPLTLTQAGDLDLTVALVDSTGHVSRIKLGALSEGVIEPYPRAGGTKTGLRFTCIDNHKTCLYPAGCNETMSQSGWQAEFETIRIRLMDFVTNATLLNLKQVSAIRFEMGGTAGDGVGRVTLDDLELSAN